METLKVIGLCGSLRKDSLNRKALKIALAIAKKYGAETKEIDLTQSNLPVYNQDFEDPFPSSVKEFRDFTSWADVFIIASPEHNHSISAALKNAIDWLSRKYEETIKGKSAIILGVSTGNYGTVRGQAHLRQILEALDIFIVPQPEILIPNGSQTFDDQGNLVDEKSKALIEAVIQKTFAQHSEIIRIKNSV